MSDLLKPFIANTTERSHFSGIKALSFTEGLGLQGQLFLLSGFGQ